VLSMINTCLELLLGFTVCDLFDVKASHFTGSMKVAQSLSTLRSSLIALKTIDAEHDEKGMRTRDSIEFHSVLIQIQSRYREKTTGFLRFFRFIQPDRSGRALGFTVCVSVTGEV